MSRDGGDDQPTPPEIWGERKRWKKWREKYPATSSILLWARDPLKRKPGLPRKYEKEQTRRGFLSMPKK
jgi:hypothetical protein